MFRSSKMPTNGLTIVVDVVLVVRLVVVLRVVVVGRRVVVVVVVVVVGTRISRVDEKKESFIVFHNHLLHFFLTINVHR